MLSYRERTSKAVREDNRYGHACRYALAEMM